MLLDGTEALFIMRLVNRLKKKFIAKILTDIEAEFQNMHIIARRVSRIRAQMDTRDAIDTKELLMLLDQLEKQLPAYAIVRKIVLDNLNEFARNIFQVVLGDDVEGYDRRYHSRGR